MSEVSATDVKLYLGLSNEEVVNTSLDVNRVMEEVKISQACPPLKTKLDTVTEEKETIRTKGEEEEDVQEDDDFDDYEDEEDEDDDDGEEDDEGDEEEEEGDDDEEEDGDSFIAESVPESIPESIPESVASALHLPSSPEDIPQDPPPSLPRSRSGFPPPPRPPSAEDLEELMLQKQSVLLELERLKSNGVTLSRRFTMNDRLEDMQFEVRRHLLNIDEQNTVQFMRDTMRIVFSGIEIANGKLGPFLDLDGWAAEVGADMSRYDSSLSRLYRKYWRRSTMSPEMELAVGILGSMGMHHFKRKFASTLSGGGGGGASKGAAAGLGALGALASMRGLAGGGGAGPSSTAPRSVRAPPPSGEESDEEGLPESFK